MQSREGQFDSPVART
nr:unnamed protein product [Callosobruchus chinensis]